MSLKYKTLLLMAEDRPRGVKSHGLKCKAEAAFCRHGLQSQFQKTLNILGLEAALTGWPMHYRRGSGRPDKCVGRLLDSLSVRGLLYFAFLGEIRSKSKPIHQPGPQG